jgi:hypothetical protein
MKVVFKDSCEIEIFESFDEAQDDGETSTEVFLPGEEVEFDVIGFGQKMTDFGLAHDPNIVNVQFPNGHVAFGLSTDWFDGDELKVQAVLEYAKSLGLEAEDLDDLVHDAFSCQASQVNNAGIEAQVECLSQGLDANDVQRELHTLAQSLQK